MSGDNHINDSTFRIAQTCLIAICCLLLPSLLHAARMPVDYEIEAGFDGVVGDNGGVFPVAITIENKVASTTGIIELSQPDVSGNFEVTQLLQIVMPAPSRKRFVMLARIENNRDLQVNVRFKDYIKDIRKEVTVARTDKPIALCLGMPNTFRFGGAAAKYRFVNVGKNAIPSDPLALDCVHAMIVSGAAFAMLDREQVKAMREWTATGGTLILHDPASETGFGANLGALLRDLKIDINRRGMTRFGAGIIASSGADPEPTLAFWDNDRNLALLLFPNLRADEDERNSPYTGHFTNMLRSHRARGVAGFTWILLIVAGYIITIGPLDLWLVKRFNKPYLTWVFFPAAIVIFSAIAYGYSSFVNVGTMRTVRLNIIDGSSDSGVARGNSLFWVYSAKNATYEIETTAQDVFFSGRETLMGAGAIAGVEIENGVHSTISARIPIFSSKEFDATWYLPSWNQAVTCRREGANIRITVPAADRVTAAFLADKDGLMWLEPIANESDKTNLLYSTTTRIPWESVVRDRAVGLESQTMRRGRYEETELMPSVDALRNYLICVSYPWKVTEKKNNNYSYHEGIYFRQGRDFRERSLDIRNRLNYGPTLLLFMGDSGDFLPINIKRNFPTTMKMNLLRIQIPDNG